MQNDTEFTSGLLAARRLFLIQEGNGQARFEVAFDALAVGVALGYGKPEEFVALVGELERRASPEDFGPVLRLRTVSFAVPSVFLTGRQVLVACLQSDGPNAWEMRISAVKAIEQLVKEVRENTHGQY